MHGVIIPVVASSIPVTAPALTSRTGLAPANIPWYIWCAVAAVTSSMIGVHWDISWHRSIGRDTFWTPAHIAIYMGGVLAGLSCAYLILTTTFSPQAPLRDASVKIWGFRGPLGAFISAWGGIAMLTSAPFDDWWHNAYGLDVKILSPPHVVLALGMISIKLGALILILGQMNRSQGASREKLNRLFLYIGGMLVVALLALLLEYTQRIFLHTGRVYRVLAMAIPIILVGVSKASGKRWAATTVAAIYSVFLLGLLWVLPLFPAEPKLGPVYHQVTHFIPNGFPVLIIVPALLLDILWARTASWNRWLVALVSGFVFLGALFAAEWPFADFLMSPGARNWFFGSHYFDYYVSPNSYTARWLFYPLETAAQFRTELTLALIAAILSTRLGLGWGAWMERIKR